MNISTSLPPRKDPIRAGRIFMLASELTLNDLRHDPANAERLRARTAQLLTSALECLLLAREEQTKGLAAFGLNAGIAADDAHLNRSITLLADILATFRNSAFNDLEELMPPLATLVADLVSVESN